jgi:gamma-glutamyltranspeptidase/glutathione hydrolase
MEDLLAPAVEYARQGFPVSEVIARDWEQSVAIHRQWPGFLETFTLKGRAPRAGEVFSNPHLAATLEKIGRSGRKAFYQGEIPRRIESYFEGLGGFLSARDLSDHRSEWVEPVSTDYRGCRVWQLPPNGQGIAVLQMLNLLEAYDIAAMGFGTTDHIHHFVEATKLVFEDRARFYADPVYVLGGKTA